MSNYPPGSMMGSGIYSTDFEDERICEAELEEGVFCDFEGTVLVYVSDFGTEYWDCPKCNCEHSLS